MTIGQGKNKGNSMGKHAVLGQSGERVVATLKQMQQDKRRGVASAKEDLGQAAEGHTADEQAADGHGQTADGQTTDGQTADRQTANRQTDTRTDR